MFAQVQLLTSQAREVQLLMEEEIESNNYETAALLQLELEWILERCLRLQQSVRVGEQEGARAGGCSLRGGTSLSSTAHESDVLSSGERDHGCEQRKSCGDLEGGRAGGGDGSEGASLEKDSSTSTAARMALQESINLLHRQLEAALGEEDFDLCDALNAEISSLSRQRDSLLDPDLART